MDNSKIKELGQFFTPQDISDFMVELIDSSKESLILEPSAGNGVFLDSLWNKNFKNIAGYEIDKSVISKKWASLIINKSFLDIDVTKKYDVIIGNPPYVRWKNISIEQQIELTSDTDWQTYCNSLCDLLFIFILKSIKMLNIGGELIFITPSFWMKTMHAKKLRQFMIDNGYIDTIIDYSEAQVFPKVASSILIFKFIKSPSKINKKIKIYKYIGPKKVVPHNKKDIIFEQNIFKSFEDEQPTVSDPWVFIEAADKKILSALEKFCSINDEVYRLGDLAKIGNGMVSGYDKAFQMTDDLKNIYPNAHINVLKAKNLSSIMESTVTPYIFLENIQEEKILEKEYKDLHEHFKPFREQLEKRYDYGNNTKYWQWSFLRSFNYFKDANELLMIPCKERITNKERLRVAIAPPKTFPTQDIVAFSKNQDVQEDSKYIAGLIISKAWFFWVHHKGLIKGGIAEFSEQPLKNIPIKKIDWTIESEVKFHNSVVKCVDNNDLNKLDKIIFEQININIQGYHDL